MLMTASSAMAQNSTFNGIVTDQDGGVLPGATIITVNLNTVTIDDSAGASTKTRRNIRRAWQPARRKSRRRIYGRF